MRILVIHCAYKLRSGEDIVVEQEVKLLRSNGNEVELLLFNNDGSQLLKLLQLPFNISSYKKTIQKIEEFKPEAVHIHNLHFAGSASVLYAVKHCKVPMVATLHNFRWLCPAAILFVDGNLFLHSVHQPFPYSAVKKKVFRNSYILTFWMALSMKLHSMLGTHNLPDKLIFLTEHARDVFRNSHLKIKKLKTVVKPNFVAPPVLYNVKKKDNFLYVGRLSEDKGVMLVLDTFAASNLTIHIAGDGPLKETVKAYRDKYPNIHYLGLLTSQQVHAAMEAATALVFPSIWYEGMPLTIIEAFARYLPVIASDLGAMHSMIDSGFNGLHFEPANKVSFQKAIYEWYNTPEETKEWYSINARSTYERLYSPEANVEQLMSIYHSVINTKEAAALSLA